MVILHCNSDEFIISTDEMELLVLFAPVLNEDETFISFAIDVRGGTENWFNLYRLAWAVDAVDAEDWDHFAVKPEAVGFYDRSTAAAVLMKEAHLREYEYIYVSSQ